MMSKNSRTLLIEAIVPGSKLLAHLKSAVDASGRNQYCVRSMDVFISHINHLEKKIIKQELISMFLTNSSTFHCLSKRDLQATPHGLPRNGCFEHAKQEQQPKGEVCLPIGRIRALDAAHRRRRRISQILTLSK